MDDDLIKIVLDFENENYVVDKRSIGFIATEIMNMLGLDNFELSILITDNNKIQELNTQFRNKNAPTDVLSFPQTIFDTPITVDSKYNKPKSNSKHSPLLGDIVISLEYTETNAKNIGQSLNDEMCFLLIHGILHLCGHDHMEADEEELMFGQQRILMKAVKDLFLTNKLASMLDYNKRGSIQK